MTSTHIRLLFITILMLIAGCISICAQQEADKSVLKPEDPDSSPKNIKEMMVKMRIDESKKQYDEMLDRGQQAVKISEQLEKDFAAKNQLSPDDLSKLEGLEKLVKKIRGELGGGDDERVAADDDQKDDPMPTNAADGIKALGQMTTKLVNELNNTSRFSISVAAIETSNSVLKVVRFLRLSK
jgi:hypothetical protein